MGAVLGHRGAGGIDGMSHFLADHLHVDAVCHGPVARGSGANDDVFSNAVFRAMLCRASRCDAVCREVGWVRGVTVCSLLHPGAEKMVVPNCWQRYLYIIEKA